MPSKSAAQRRLMAAVAHGWKPPVGSGIHVPVKVAEEFNAADRGKKLGSRVMSQAMMGRTKKNEKTMAKIVQRRARQLSK